jgi:fructosamine-3-kinase
MLSSSKSGKTVFSANQWIDIAHNPKVQTKMGIELAKLHQNTAQYFGFEFDNKIGQTPQPNKSPCNNAGLMLSSSKSGKTVFSANNCRYSF